MRSKNTTSMVKLRDGRLHIFLRPGCENYYYRFFFNGKYITRTAKTANLALAKSIGENAYDEHRLQHYDASGKSKLSWNEAVLGVLKSLQTETSRQSRIRDYQVKYRILGDFFAHIPIPDIKERTLEEYVHWRRTIYKPLRGNYHGTWGKSSSAPNNKTILGDFNALRRVLKYALREEAI